MPTIGDRMEPHAGTGTRLDPTRERALVARARVDASAFGELYDFYLPRIHGFVARRVADPAVAEDLTAVTFERALTAVRRGDFRNEAFGGWLYRVAANAVVDHVRRSRRSVSLGRRATVGGPDRGDEATVGDDRAERALTAALDRDVLRQALVRVSAAHRRLLVLRYLDGLGTDELCAVLGCSPATLAVRHHRALRAVRAELATESIDVA
jgi:RNA polymerase sigma-70 factor (ECF subfamily)